MRPQSKTRSRRSPILALLPGLVFTANLFCPAICDLEAVSLSAGEPAAGKIHISCQHHVRRGGSQDSTSPDARATHAPQHAHPFHSVGASTVPHDEDGCSGCIRPAEPAGTTLFSIVTPDIVILPLPELGEPKVGGFFRQDRDEMVRPPDEPLYLRLNILLI